MRFWLGKVALPAALVNVGINVVVGRALFRGEVPLFGQMSIAGDTLVGSFAIGFFTLLAVAPGARREARLGRVRGGGRPAVKRGRFGSAALFALSLVAIFGAPTVGVLALAGVEKLAHVPFLWFKTTYAGVVGVIAALAVARLAIAREPDRSADPRWCKRPSGPGYDFDYFDKGGLAVTSREHGCSATPTWELRVTGALDAAHVRAALADLVVRYPTLAMKVQALDGAPPAAARYRYAYDRAFSIDRIFDVIEVDAAGIETLARELRNRHTDLFGDFPMTLTLAQGAERRLFFRQHHGIADGRAFIGLLADFALFLEHARKGTRPPAAALEPIGRLSELAPLALPRGRFVAWTVSGVVRTAGAVLGALVRPMPMLKQNRSNDYSGENGTVHWILPDSALDAWNAARKRIGCSLNSLLTAALFIAARGLEGVPIARARCSLMMETRPRNRPFASFANHLAMLRVDLAVGGRATTSELAPLVQAQVDAQRTAALRRLVGERAIALSLPLEDMQRIVFDSKHPSDNLAFSNLIALDIPPLGGDGWSVDEIRITTPVTPRLGLLVTVIRYRGKLCFNFNYKSTAASREDAERLCGYFQDALS